MIVSVFAAFCLGLLAGVILREYVPVTGYCRAFFYIKRGKRAYPVLPFVSIKYAFLLLAILFLVLVIIEYSQPHYDEWRVERALRERLHADITGHMLEKYEAPGEYPLWQREGYEVEITGTEKNILVLGDSFVHQYSHADANQLWWKQLDKVLKQRGYHDVNVYAVGVEGGAATYDHMRWLRDTDMVRDLQPDLIIMGYVTNDTDRYNGWSRDEIIKTYWEPDVFDKYNTLHAFKTVFPNFAYLINDMVQKKKPPTNYNDEIGYPMEIQELELVSGERLANYNRYAVAPLGETLAKLDIPAFLVTSPRHLDAAYYEPLYAPVLPLFEKAGITTYNLLYDMIDARYDGVDEQNVGTNPADSHPGTFAAWFYANYIADVLEHDYPEVLGERADEAPVYDIHVNFALPASIGPTVLAETPIYAQYEIAYPASGAADAFLYQPLKQDYVKFCFQYPVDINYVRIEGDNLEELTLYTTRIDQKRGYDTQEMFDEGTKTTAYGSLWPLDAGQVTALCFSAKTTDGAGGKITVTVEASKGGVRP